MLLSFRLSVVKIAPSRTGGSVACTRWRSTKGRPSAAGADGAQLQDVVLPAPATAKPLPVRQEEKQLIDDTYNLYQQTRFHQKCAELERMEVTMANACLALERVSPTLFRAAMIRDRTLKMPIERRAPLDTPPTGGWNHENVLRMK